MAKPSEEHTTCATASASVSRTFLVVFLRRSPLCNCSCAELVGQYRQGFCFRHAGLENDSAAVGDAIGLHCGVAVFEGYARSRDVLDHALKVDCRVAFDPARSEIGKGIAFGLVLREDVDGPEAYELCRFRVDTDDIALRLCPFRPHHGSHNHDSVLTFLDVATERRLPRMEPGDSRSVRLLAIDEHGVGKTVFPEASHRLKIAGEHFGLAFSERRNELLGRGGDGGGDGGLLLSGQCPVLGK